MKDAPALIVRLRGGLGNQLFQYAAGRSLADRSRVPLMLDTKSGFQGDPYGRSYALDRFKLSDSTAEADSTKCGLRADLRRRILRRLEIAQLKFLGRYDTPAIHRMHISELTVLDAYCQSPGYFRGVDTVLKEELSFKSIPADIDPLVSSEIRSSNSVCVHARRLLGVCADPAHTNPSLVNYYGACEIGYYRNALSKLVREYGPVTAYLFSDDPAWAKRNAHSLAGAGCTVKVIDESDTMKSFYLMRLCRHFVLSNSTFGWWAAWLGEFVRKTVCVPSVWNRGEKRFPLELFPESWRVVPTA
jgi:hypothetical protein